jgi:hypothetical protein
LQTANFSESNVNVSLFIAESQVISLMFLPRRVKAE